MKERIKMNSKNLQKTFDKVYRDYFIRNDIIISGNFSIQWDPSGIKNSSYYIKTRSKIPLKCFVGLKARNDDKIVFKNITTYNLIDKQFEEISYGSQNKEEQKTQELIKSFLESSGIVKGLDIEILSEVTRGHSFGFSGTTSALISAGISEYLSKDLQSNLDEIFRFGCKLHFIQKYGNTNGHVVLNTLLDSKELGVYFSELLSGENIEDFNNFKYSFFNLKEKFCNKIDLGELPFDYSIIYCGIPSDTRKIEQYKKSEVRNYELIKDNIKDYLGIDKENKHYHSKFLKDKEIIDYFSDMLSILNIKNIGILKRVLENGYDSSTIDDLIDQINKYRYALNIIGKQSPFADDFIYNFRNNSQNPEETVGIMPLYSSKLGGGYLVVTKPGISRLTIEKAIGALGNIYPNTLLEYSSYLDGEDSAGVKVEQNLNKKIYSKYVEKDNFIYKNNQGEIKIGEYNMLLSSEKDGILLDIFNSKMQINGEKLTSKDLMSQNTTIEILVKLLDNPEEDVSNKDLPISSYTKSKNEMLGKIILPLIKLTEEKFNTQLPIICKGTFNDFYIKLNPTDIRIGYIKKL